MLKKSTVFFLSAIVMLFANTAFSANTYENLSINYAHSETKFTDSALPAYESNLAFVNYVSSDEEWTTSITMSYLPEQKTQDNPSLTVKNQSWSASLGILNKIALTKNMYIGPKAVYAYGESEKTTLSPSPTSEKTNADSLTGVITLGYCLTKNSDLTLNYTFRDDFLESNEDNERPVNIDLLYTLSNDDSFHFSVGTVTEKQSTTDSTYTVTVGYGSTF
jgi:hypothetical protein